MSATEIPKVDSGAIGAVLLETFFATVLCGLTSHQVFRYYRMFPRDLSQHKKMVAILIILCFLDTIFAMHSNYYYLVTKRSQVTYLGNTVWSMKLVMIISDLIAFVTRLFFIQRLYIITKANLWLLAPATVLTVMRIGFNIATFVISFLAISSVKSSRAVDDITKLSYVVGAMSDVIISVSLSYYLFKTNRKSTEESSPIESIILYAVNAGLLSSAISIAALICIMSISTRFASIGLVQLGGSMYVNSFMTVVNSRRSQYSPSQVGSFQLGVGLVDEMIGLDLMDVDKNKRNAAAVAIHVTRETHTIVDNNLAEPSDSSVHSMSEDISDDNDLKQGI